MDKFEKGLAEIAVTAATGAIDRNMDGIVRTVMESLFKHKWYPFIAGAQMALIEAGMEPLEAWFRAKDVCINFVKDEGLAFGQAGHDWGPSGGHDVATECEIAHWETA